jgi:hypothetical protein
MLTDEQEYIDILLYRESLGCAQRPNESRIDELSKVTSETELLTRISDAFSKNCWRDNCNAALNIVRAVRQLDGLAKKKQILGAIPGIFFAANDTNRNAVWTVLSTLLTDVSFRSEQTNENSATPIHIAYWIGAMEVNMRKTTTVNNNGIFAGNVDSEGAVVNLEQQQMVKVDAEQQLAQLLLLTEVRAIIDADIPAKQKKKTLAHKLKELSGHTLKVTTDFAAKVLAEVAAKNL